MYFIQNIFPLSRYALLKCKNSSSLSCLERQMPTKEGEKPPLGWKTWPPSLIIIITVKLRGFQAKMWEKE